MIHPIKPHRPLQNGKYFLLLKLIILQQNIASVWIFGDQIAWDQRGHEINIIIQHLVGTLPKYVYDVNTTKAVCMDHDQVKIVNIIFVSKSSDSEDLHCTCPTDYTIVLVPDSSITLRLPRKRSHNILRRIVFGTIHNSDIDNIKTFKGRRILSLPVNTNALHKLFFPKPFNHSAVFRIHLQLRPPNTMMYFLNKTYGFYGVDVKLAGEISKKLNMTLLIQSNVGIEYPNFASWFNASDERFKFSEKLLTNRKRIIPSLKAIYDFYRNCSPEVDMCISGQPLRTTDTKISTFLYPHYKECLRFVVPHIKNEKQFAEKLANHSIVQSVCLSIILMFISKIILHGSCRLHNYTHTFNVILAELFGQKRPKASTKFWEKMWNVQLLTIAIFSTALLSAISYQTLVSVKYVKQIDTLDDLIESNLEIFVEKFRSKDVNAWERNLDPRLRSKFVYKSELINLILKTSNAVFVWDERMAWLHIRISEFMSKNGGSAEMRLAKEPLYCGFSSSRILAGSAFKHTINRLNERLFSSGIRMEQMEWTLEYLRAYHRKTVDDTSGGRLQPLSLYRIYGIVVLLIGGLGLGCIIFILEIFWKSFAILRRRQALHIPNKYRVKRHKNQKVGVRCSNKNVSEEKSKNRTPYCGRTK